MTEIKKTDIEIKLVTIKNVTDVAAAVWNNEKRTPLVLNESGLMDRFYQHRHANIIDAQSLFLKEENEKISRDEIMEDVRRKLVNAMKFGKTLVISMKRSAADISTKYNGAHTFPVPEVFMPHMITDEKSMEQICQRRRQSVSKYKC